MTTEEAEQLIAEINNIEIADAPYGHLIHLSDAIEAVKRLANKPPYVLNTHMLGERDGQIELDSSEKLPRITLRPRGLAECYMYITKYELQQLRDNCTKMLEYLDAH